MMLLFCFPIISLWYGLKRSYCIKKGTVQCTGCRQERIMIIFLFFEPVCTIVLKKQMNNYAQNLIILQ